MRSARFQSHMNHVSVSPTDGNGPTQGQSFSLSLCGPISICGANAHNFNSSAYRKKYSCETTPINLVEAWGEARDKHLFLSIMSTDISKAFDSSTSTAAVEQTQSLRLPG